jgi:hypothetical protein
MIQKLGGCKGECGRTNVPVNAKGLCSECQYLKTHGKTRQETYSERRIEKDKLKPKQTYSYTLITLKSSKKRKKTVSSILLKNEKLEKRREQIRKDEETYEQVFNSRPHECEECGRELPDVFRDENEMVIARWQYSHILGKGSHGEYRNCFWNFQRLCLQCHQIYEFGDRYNMKTYQKSKIVVIKNIGLDLL